jgi:phage shock protein A
MSKHGIIGRVAQLSRADVDAIISSAQQPRQVLDQLVRDYMTTVAEAEQAIVQLTDNLRVAAADQQEDTWAVAAWGRKAEAASQDADELRAAGAAAEADRFDRLARAALRRQLIAENDVEIDQHIITAQHESIEKLSSGVGQMRSRLSGLKHRQDALATGSTSTGSTSTGPASTGPTSARARFRDAITTIEIMDPSSEVVLFEEQVRREEARAHGAEALPASALDALFSAFDDIDNAQIDERLKAVKAGRAMASVQAKVRAQAHDQPFR